MWYLLPPISRLDYQNRLPSVPELFVREASVYWHREPSNSPKLQYFFFSTNHKSFVRGFTLYLIIMTQMIRSRCPILCGDYGVLFSYSHRLLINCIFFLVLPSCHPSSASCLMTFPFPTGRRLMYPVCSHLIRCWSSLRSRGCMSGMNQEEITNPPLLGLYCEFVSFGVRCLF